MKDNTHIASCLAWRASWLLFSSIVFCGGISFGAPLRYRHPIESWGCSIVVSEWGVLAGTDDEGERAEISMECPDGRKHKCVFEAFGRVTDSWAADLDADGMPEVIVITESFGTGSYGEICVVKETGQKLITMTIPELTDVLKNGYMGHDNFQRGGERRIIRTFPIYLDSDGNSKANGGARMIVYALKGKQLVVADTRDFPPKQVQGANPALIKRGINKTGLQ